MTDFTLTEDLPISEIEFDQRFISTGGCYEYLAQIKWPDGNIGDKVGRVLMPSCPPSSLYSDTLDFVAAVIFEKIQK